MSSKTAKVSASGVIASGCKILGLHVKPGTSDGTVEIKQVDGNGAASIDLEFSANDSSQYIDIPGGITYGTDAYADISNIDVVTIIYQDI